MKKLQPSTERRLLAAVEKTAELVNDGEHPNAAVVKAASECNLRPGDIATVVRAYNTGRTTRQRVDGDDLWEKAADFELADTAAVLEQLYPSQVKTAAARSTTDGPVSEEYQWDPDILLQRKKAAALRQVAIPLLSNDRTAPPTPRDTSAMIRKMASVPAQLRKLVEERRRQVDAHTTKLASQMSQLSDYFRTPGALPVPVVRELAQTLHGRPAEQIMDHVGTHYRLPKIASQMTVADADATQAPFPLIVEILDTIQQVNRAKQAYAHAEDMQRTQLQAMTREYVPENATYTGSLLDPSPSEKAASLLGKPMQALGQYALASHAMAPLAEKLKQKNDERLDSTLSDLSDPAHEMRLREINTQAMLHDLMTNDPVISGYDPNEVMTAFNDLVQLSPAISDQRMLTQALLRKQLQQGQLDTFEQDQVLNFQDKLRRRSPSGDFANNASSY